MIAAIVFEFPLGWLLSLPLAAILTLSVLRQRQSGLGLQRIIALCALRSLPLFALLFLVARPVWIAREPPASAARSAVLLLDRSESMSLQDRDADRWE